MSSVTENTSIDLKAARLLLHKIGTNFTDFQSHTLAIFSLAEEWKILQNSFEKVHKSLEDRVKDMESKEREINSQKNQLQFPQKEIELRQSKLDLDEKSLNERVKFVEIREKQVKEWCESLELEKRIVYERRSVVEVAEKRLSEEFKKVEAVERRESELRKREEVVCEKEKVFDDGLKAKEVELMENVEVRANELYEGLMSKVMDLKKKFKLMEEELFEGLKLKENELMMKEVSLEESLKVVELEEKELNTLCEGLMVKENELKAKFELMEKGLYEGLKLKDNELKMKEVSLEESRKVVELKEKELNELCEGLKVKEVEMNARVLALEQKEVKYKEDKKQVDELFDVLHSNERDVNDKKEALGVQEEEMESRCREVEAKEKELNERLEELRAKEKQINDSCDVLESQGKKVDDQLQGMELKEKEIDELRQTVELKEKQLKDGLQALHLKRKSVDERSDEVERMAKGAKKMASTKSFKKSKAAGKKIGQLTMRLRSKEKELSEQRRVKESKEKQRNRNSVVSRCRSKDFREDSRSVSRIDEQPDPNIGQVSCTVNSLPSNTCDVLHSMCKNMDVSGVRSYLMERVQEQKSLFKEMLDALRCAPDPAKLALNVFRCFHQKFQNKYLSRVNKTSCIFVLEQLMKLSPPIPYEAKVDAKMFAQHFRETLKQSNGATDSLGFLLLIATFQLANFYSADDLLSLFNVYYGGGDIYQLEEKSYLCLVLGLLGKIPGHVTSLINRKKHLTAIKFICIFKLERDFGLNSLLQAQLTYIKDQAKDRRKHQAYKSKNGAIQANSIELNNLNDFIKHIKVFKLEPIFPIDSLLSRVNELETAIGRKANAIAHRKKCDADSCAVSSAAIPNQSEKRHNAVAPVKKHDADLCSSVSSAAIPNQPEERPNVVAPVNRCNADSCAPVNSVAMSNQLEKYPRVDQDVPQVAPLGVSSCPPPMPPYTLGHASHINPNVQPTWQQGTIPAQTYGLSFGVRPHISPAPFVPPCAYPFGAPRPF